jgi:hypothetical protein
MREEGVFLLNAVPSLFSNNIRVVPYFFRRVSEVCVCGNQLLASVVFPVPGLTHNQNIISAPEGISVESNWLEDNFTLASHCVVGTTTIVVPLRKISNRIDLAVKHSCL